MRTSLLLSLLLFIATMAQAQPALAGDDGFWLGADISGATELEARGHTLRNAAGEPREATALMRELGLRAVRLRVWVNPRHGFSGTDDVVLMAQRAKAEGMAVMIDFHYSDHWADPGKQFIPAAWKAITCDEMRQALSTHTRDVLLAVRQTGADVRWVQVGNETTNGFLWPVGRVPDQMAQYAALTDAGYAAVKEVFPQAQVIVHLDCASDPKRYDLVFDGLQAHHARWDMIGLSVYPYWDMKDGRTRSWRQTVRLATRNINRLWEKYHTPLMIVETGTEVSRPERGRRIMRAVIRSARRRTHGHCKGVFYWAPELEGHYPLGAFRNGQPTAIMDAFTEAAKKNNR